MSLTKLRVSSSYLGSLGIATFGILLTKSIPKSVTPAPAADGI